MYFVVQSTQLSSFFQKQINSILELFFSIPHASVGFPVWNPRIEWRPQFYQWPMQGNRLTPPSMSSRNLSLRTSHCVRTICTITNSSVCHTYSQWWYDCGAYRSLRVVGWWRGNMWGRKRAKELWTTTEASLFVLSPVLSHVDCSFSCTIRLLVTNFGVLLLE